MLLLLECWGHTPGWYMNFKVWLLLNLWKISCEKEVGRLAVINFMLESTAVRCS